jgi:hypothetical protein
VRRWRIKAPNRWGEKLGAPRMSLTVKLFRAGFEPLRGSTTPSGLERPENDHILGDATRTHGSNPARSSQRSGIRFPAPRFSPYRPLGPHSTVSPLTGCSLSGAMGCNFRSVAAGAHAAPAPPVILGGIVEEQVATFIRTFSNQHRIRITKQISCRFGKRGEQR